MYLVRIDDETGMVKLDDENDGIMAIPEFRDLVNDLNFGRGAMTCVALVVDWLSPIRYWADKDRPKKAMKDVMNNKNAFVWENEKIQLALKKYFELQYNPALVEKTRLDDVLASLTEKFRTEQDVEEQMKIHKQLSTFKGLIQQWNKENEDSDPYSKGPVENGYSLSRLEEKLRDKNSFFNATFER